MPTVSAAAVVGMMAGITVGIIKAIGDYHICAHLSEVPSPPTHAINRGRLYNQLIPVESSSMLVIIEYLYCQDISCLPSH